MTTEGIVHRGAGAEEARRTCGPTDVRRRERAKKCEEGPSLAASGKSDLFAPLRLLGVVLTYYF